MKKYIEIIFKKKKIFFVIFAVLNILAIFGLTKIKMNTDFSIFSVSSSQSEEILTDLQDSFQSRDNILIVLEDDDFTNEDISLLYDYQEYLNSIDSISYVSGVIPEELSFAGNIITHDQMNTVMLESYFNMLQDFSPVKEMDGKTYYVISIYIEENFGRQQLKDIESITNELSYENYISGELYNQLKVVDYILSILIFLPPIAILVILIVFGLQLGKFKTALLSVLPAGIGSLWTFGIIGFLGNEISILTAIVPIFVIVIGSADGLHFLTHYQEGIKQGFTVEKSLYETLRVVGKPMVITTLTSMVGFLSLLSMNTGSVVDLAYFATLGIFLAGVATWFVLPLILTNNINVLPKKERKEHPIFSKQLRAIWGLPSILIIILIIIGAFLSYSYIKNEFNILMIYKDSTLVAKNSAKVSEVNGGDTPVFVMIDEQSVLSYDSYVEVQGIVDELNGLSEVDHVLSPFSIFDIMMFAQTGQHISNDAMLQSAYQNILTENPEMVSSFINIQENKIKLVVFPVNIENATLDAISSNVINNHDNVVIGGVQYVLKELNDNIFTMQLYSILIAISAVFLMMFISLRNFKIAIISLIPIVVSVLAIYMFLGISGISLNISTVMIFSITIGVGIDYAVHFSSVYKLFLSEGKTKLESVDIAFKYSSKPIITNALGVALGLTVLMLSPLTIHFNVSILMWVGMAIGVIVTLSILPTIFRGKLHS